jgi:hypothetical protein
MNRSNRRACHAEARRRRKEAYFPMLDLELRLRRVGRTILHIRYVRN